MHIQSIFPASKKSWETSYRSFRTLKSAARFARLVRERHLEIWLDGYKKVSVIVFNTIILLMFINAVAWLILAAAKQHTRARQAAHRACRLFIATQGKSS